MTPVPIQPQNVALAAKLRELADLLTAQGADGFRFAAYRRAADVVEALDSPVSETFAAKGRQGLVTLPGIGTGIASALAEMATTGHWSQLERLRGTLEPERLFRTIPGIGPELARAIFDALNIDTLESLEIAAHDGGLERVKGIGPRRAQMIRAALSERLGGAHLRSLRAAQERPPVSMLLDIDHEYREKAQSGTLPRVAPRRFNPTADSWLPILHARRGPWAFTALYSNTARAHRLGRERDWVVIYHHNDDLAEGQCTVVTESPRRLVWAPSGARQGDGVRQPT